MNRLFEIIDKPLGNYDSGDGWASDRRYMNHLVKVVAMAGHPIGGAILQLA